MPRPNLKGAWLAVVVLSLGACKSTARDEPSDTFGSLETPVGFKRITEEGWSLAVPATFTPRTPPEGPEGAPMIWLINRGDRRAKGAPYLFFAYDRKPAEFESRVFGLAALDGLKRQAPRKVVLSERQHALGGVVVTDIEVLSKGASRTTHEWRRLFVLDGRAYILTFASEEASAGELAGTARKVIDSLVRHPE